MEYARCGRGEGSTEAVHTPRHGSRKILFQISAPPLLRCVPLSRLPLCQLLSLLTHRNDRVSILHM